MKIYSRDGIEMMEICPLKKVGSNLVVNCQRSLAGITIQGGEKPSDLPKIFELGGIV